MLIRAEAGSLVPSHVWSLNIEALVGIDDIPVYVPRLYLDGR